MKRMPILLVEDMDEDAELTLRALEECGVANRITRAHDGAEALDFLFRRGAFAERPNEHPVVVLLDLKLPRIDGLDVLRALRAEPSTHHVPVVVMTSSKQSPDIAAAYEAGANAYVVKPIGFEEFARAVQSIGHFWILTNEAPI